MQKFSLPPLPDDMYERIFGNVRGNGVYQDRSGRIREAPPARRVEFYCLADVPEKLMRWSWLHRIPRGKLVLFTGLPDTGKSSCAIDIGARHTTAAPWPDGSGNAPAGSVVLLTAEDAVADTIRPRFEAAGADLRRVHGVKSVAVGGRPGWFSLQDDLEQLAAQVRRLGDVIQIIIDPITAYFGTSIDSYKATEVRSVLSPLNAFAEQYDLTVVGITHPSKTVIKAINAATGSQAFVATSRAAWLFTREIVDGEETGRVLMTSIKNNLKPRDPKCGLAFQLQTYVTGIDNHVGRVVWDAGPVSVSADDALAAVMNPTPGSGGDRLGVAVQFIIDEIDAAGGRAEATVVKAAATRAGIARITLDRAKDRLKVVSSREGFGRGGKFFWSLPIHPHPSSLL